MCSGGSAAAHHHGRLPHSEIPGSSLDCSSPRRIVAYHVLHRPFAPRHPPRALRSLITRAHTLQFKKLIKAGVLCPTIAIPLLLTLLSISTTFSPQPHSTPPKKARPGGQGEHMRLCVTLEVSLHTMQLSKCGDVAAGQSNLPVRTWKLLLQRSFPSSLITYRGNPQSTTTLMILSRIRLRLYTATANTHSTKIPRNKRHPSEQANVTA